MQCGPIRYKDSARDQAALRPFEHKLIVRRTDFVLPAELSVQAEPPIQDIYSAIIADSRRNAIADACSGGYKSALGCAWICVYVHRLF